MKRIILLSFFIGLFVAVNLEAGIVSETLDAPPDIIESNNPAISSHTATLYITTTSYQICDYVQVINPNTSYDILVSTSSAFNKIIGAVLKNKGSYIWNFQHGFMYFKYDA